MIICEFVTDQLTILEDEMIKMYLSEDKKDLLRVLFVTCVFVQITNCFFNIINDFKKEGLLK